MDNDFKRPLGPTATGATRPAASLQREPGYQHDVDAGDQPLTPSSTENPKNKSSIGKVLLRIVTVLVLLGLAGASGWYWLQNDNARKDLASAESSLASAVSAKTVAEAKLASALKDTPLQAEEATGETAAKLAAAKYACILASFGCDKVVTTTTKFKAVKAPDAGFAVIEIKNANVSTNVFVKSADDMTWTVIYESQLKPSADIVTKYAIPQDFVLGE